MTTPPAIPTVPPTSWIQAHAEHLAALMRSKGHDEHSATNTLLVALTEEAGLAWEAYTRWVSDPRYVTGEADIHLALAGITLTAYTLAHHLRTRLDHWCVLKLRHIEADQAAGKGNAVSP